MLSCENLSVELPPMNKRILDSATAQFQVQGLNAVIGPSGCGKTTLVKAMLGLMESSGAVRLDNDLINGSSDLVGKVAFVPQFSIASEALTVWEALTYTFELRRLNSSQRDAQLTAILRRIGLDAQKETVIKRLSGGQLRRLGLGLELVGSPACMICDEVTSGLDPRSEDQILEVLQRLRDDEGTTFICIIHNLAKLDFFDRITVVYEGKVVFQGTLEAMLCYFEIPDALHLYDTLNDEAVEHWAERWSKASAAEEMKGAAFTGVGDRSTEVGALPALLSQVCTLLRRRALLFRRDRGYWLLTLGITIGFPLLVTLFAFDGLPQLRGLAMQSDSGVIQQMQEDLRYRVDALESASLVTGLILFQVILLTLMGSNNGAREIAGERVIYEKERFAGLRPEAYALSKLLFVSLIAIGQGVWMTLFVKYVCGFPGALLPQLVVLSMSCVSMSAICLGFSAIFGSADKASLVSVYLVGFQLPLSGIVLALPEALVWVCRPFINAYWGWAGYFGSMIDSRFYDAYRLSTAEVVPSPLVATLILLLHFVFGAFLVFWGCHKKRWN